MKHQSVRSCIRTKHYNKHSGVAIITANNWNSNNRTQRQNGSEADSNSLWKTKLKSNQDDKGVNGTTNIKKKDNVSKECSSRVAYSRQWLQQRVLGDGGKSSCAQVPVESCQLRCHEPDGASGGGKHRGLDDDKLGPGGI